MKILINKSLILLLLCLGLGENKVFYPISLGGSVLVGYDSNPLRLSENEISQVNTEPYILDGANSVYSRFINFNSNFKFYSKRTLLSYIFNENKTIFNIGYSYKHYLDNIKKSRASYSFKIDQQLGGYQHLYIDYFLMPNYYLREYEDLDYLISNQNIEEDRYLSSFFDIEKITISYQKLIGTTKNKMKFGIFNERQLFDMYFTEFDLDINGVNIQFSFYSFNHNYFKNKRTLKVYFETLNADNYTYLDGSFSTSYMDRSYKQNRLKFSFTQIISKGKSFGSMIDIYNRKNTSNLLEDDLHYLRKHSDITLSLWYKKNKHKVMLSNRNRITTSPVSWVQKLKTFDRIIFTYSYSLNTIKYN